MMGTTCKKCQLIRIFIGCAFLLIIMIGFQPERAQAVAGLVPDALTLGILGMTLGTVAFFIRLRAWRQGRQD